jgi:hypothetical protein
LADFGDLAGGWALVGFGDLAGGCALVGFGDLAGGCALEALGVSALLAGPAFFFLMGLSSSSSLARLKASSVEMKLLSDFGVRFRPNDDTSDGFGVVGSSIRPFFFGGSDTFGSGSFGAGRFFPALASTFLLRWTPFLSNSRSARWRSTRRMMTLASDTLARLGVSLPDFPGFAFELGFAGVVTGPPPRVERVGV